MAVLLIKDRDARMPTVAEWRKWINETEIPKAQKFFADHPGCEKAIADRDRLEKYSAAKEVFSAYMSGKIQLTTEELLACTTTVSNYEANPLSQQELLAIREHHCPTLDDSTPGQADPRKWKGPRLVDQWKYHRAQVDIEALKSDAVKAAELAEKDQRGCYKAGDVVQRFPDGTPHVTPPAPPFYLIEITGLTDEQAEKYCQPEVDASDPENPVIIRRRKYGLAVAAIPSAIRNKLQTDRYVKISWSQIRAYVRDKVTGTGE